MLNGKPSEMVGRKAKGPDLDMVASCQNLRNSNIDNWLFMSL